MMDGLREQKNILVQKEGENENEMMNGLLRRDDVKQKKYKKKTAIDQKKNDSPR